MNSTFITSRPVLQLYTDPNFLSLCCVNIDAGSGMKIKHYWISFVSSGQPIDKGSIKLYFYI